MTTIKAAAEEYISGILAIEQEAIAPPWTHGALLGEIYRDDSFFAVAIASERTSTIGSSPIAGFVILRQMSEDESELLQIAVDEASRRCGTADMLMGAALRFAEERSLKSIFLEVRKSNEAALALYKKHGFLPVRSRKDYYSDPIEDAVVMFWRNEK